MNPSTAAAIAKLEQAEQITAQAQGHLLDFGKVELGTAQSKQWLQARRLVMEAVALLKEEQSFRPPLVHGATVRASGEANQYYIADSGNHWIAALQFNGEKTVPWQTQAANQMAAALSAPASAPIVQTYTSDMTRPYCPTCGAPVEEPNPALDPGQPWARPCAAGHLHTYQLED